ncbi:NtaA/DmoA family FMN-dependent monooxygenase [Auritidibacter ignavus]|uniref:NtaA/DmoA family FMN-dependent monooxygenase n=1 Tax=Auritidibacter ignavus TaxID=678932 RepID=UPI003133B89F
MKSLLLNAFDMMVPVHQSPGLWRHPESRISQFDTLPYWTSLAETLEQGRFSALFLADVLGVYDVYGASAETAYRGGLQYPLLDPLSAVSAMADHTRHLGFGVTASVSYEHPFLLARRLSSLDHLTGGRLAWNIVTSYQDSSAKNMGLAQQIPHDQRYDRADEYMEVMYRLFEASLEVGAVRNDAETGVVVDPDRVHPANHRGEFFTVPGSALTHPGPQRTPLLFQAGASPRGRQFALDHAEAVFLIGATPELVRHWVDELRDGLEARGRDRHAVKIFAMATVVTGTSDADATARWESYRQFVDTEAALALFGGWTGVDLAAANPEDTLEYVTTDANRSALEAMTTLAESTGGSAYTVKDLAEFVALGGRGPVLVGSGDTVAEELRRWATTADIDGFNISAAVRPADLERFATFVTPALAERGLLSSPQPGDAPRTLREQYFNAGPHTAADHRASSYRPAPRS